MKTRQAELVRDSTHTVTWIPANMCKKGLKIIAPDGRNWTILNAYTIEVIRDSSGWSPA